MRTYSPYIALNPGKSFGSPMTGRTYEMDTINGYRFGFNGNQKDDEIYGEGNSVDFGARIYDSRLGRFFSIDPKWRDYPFWSSYCFAGNSPITHVDLYGKGPDDRVKAANTHLGKPYFQETNSQLRTGSDATALAKVDCSELVCRTLAADGLISLSQSFNTAGLITLFDNGNWEKSNTPKVGDVFLWRSGDKGHTGIVTAINADGTIQTTEAYGTDEGTISMSRKLTDFTGHVGWKGFFRPETEKTGAAASAAKKATPRLSLAEIMKQNTIRTYQMRIEWSKSMIALNNVLIEATKLEDKPEEEKKAEIQMYQEENKKEESKIKENEIKLDQAKKSG